MLIEIPYEPRPLQAKIHEALETHRFGVLVCHRRFGKTVCVINQLLKDILTCKMPNPRGAYLCPYQKQARLVAWDMLCGFCANIPGVKTNKAELAIYLPNNGKITLLGADNADSLRGIYLDSVVLDEVAQMSRRVWGEVIRPALSDRKGRAMFIGTPAGRNVFYDFYNQGNERDPETGEKANPDWFSMLITHEDSGYVDAEEIKALKKELSEDEFAQEMMCSWSAAIRGAYYGHVMNEAQAEGRIGRVAHDEMLPVVATFDLGMNDQTVVWFLQVVGSEVRAIDCQAFTGTGLPDIFKWIKEHRSWYNIQQWIGPHDLRVREMGTGVSRYEVAQRNGVNFDIARNIPIIDGINATRSMIKRMWFDEELCRDGIEALRQYKAEYDDKRGAFSTRPIHDWTSDYADSLRYFAVKTSAGARTGKIQQQELELDLTGTF